MAAPQFDIIQTNYRNPHASTDLTLSLIVTSNTPEEELINNVKENSEKYENWLQMKLEHGGVAVLVGGGYSINNHIEDIRNLKDSGATIISMNGSAKWLREHGISPDMQVIVDAKEETSIFVDSSCKNYFASQCNPKTLEKSEDLTLIHFGLETIEQFLPEHRVKKGGYTLLGAGGSVGMAALSVAFSQGYRNMHIFGYDSSYADDNSHGYEQPMNQFMPTVNITWAGKTFKTSVAMKGQAEKFPLNAIALKNAGCELHVYGDGLLQTIYNTDYSKMTEKEKYQLMWNFPSYRIVSPGEHIADFFIKEFKPSGTIIDFGCGTGRAGLKFNDSGLNVILVDFTDNCRDNEALKLFFIQHDLTNKMDLSADYGFCTDVMEHIPTYDVRKVLKNITECADKVFFQISTIDDVMGEMIGEVLHHTVKPHVWWANELNSIGCEILWDQEGEIASLFYVSKKDKD